MFCITLKSMIHVSMHKLPSLPGETKMRMPLFQQVQKCWNATHIIHVLLKQC